MDSISSATPACLESTRQAKHHNRSNFGRRLLRSGSFQAILFYSPELSHESTAKPRSAPQTLSAPEETVRLGGTLKKLLSWANVIGATPWCLASSLDLGSFHSCRKPGCLGTASSSHLSRPSRKRKEGHLTGPRGH